MSCPMGGEHEDIERKFRWVVKWRIYVCQKCGRITWVKKAN